MSAFTQKQLVKSVNRQQPLRFLSVKITKSGPSQKETEIHVPDRNKERDLMELQQEIRHLHHHGHYPEALEKSQELLKANQDYYGKDHPATASANNNCGLLYKLLGRFSEAQSHYHDALRSYALIVGKDHASYAAALHNLGMLFKTQVQLDESLTGMQRLQFTDEAVEYLEEALKVREVELGPEHPHTVASRSALGSTIASQVLHIQSKQKDDETAKPSKMTLRRWEVAEEHLRKALETATANPRGQQIEKSKGSPYKNIITLSAANAGQNLAVILKSRASLEQNSLKREDALTEAKRLYKQVLSVRTELLQDESHPDIIATKHSLAELFDSIGDEKAANALRQEIMDAYNVTEIDDDDDKSEAK